MKLVDALEILNRPIPEGAKPFGVALACGFTPLHLETFLAAELRQALPSSSVEVSTGAFDDLTGNIQRSVTGDGDVIVVAIEWADVDPRLGLRRLGGWKPTDVEDILRTAEKQLGRLAGELSRAAAAKPVVCSLPTLPIPPIFLQPARQAGPQELELRASVVRLAQELSQHANLRLVGRRLDALSPLSGRHDPKSEIANGFPYTLAHASALAQLLAQLAREQPPKKGLITDLDDTLWRGIVGEIGPGNVSWSDGDGDHRYALYQQFVASLASAGVLVGAASKNEPAVVEEVFAREDMLLEQDAIFPFEVHWGLKSESVARILEAWNVAADDVVFVDDSPLEVAQVQSVFPQIEGFVFPANDYPALLSFFEELRERFGKRATNEEDALRLASIRSAAPLRRAAKDQPAASADDFLRDVRGTISFRCGRDHDARALELINKTNQFNLNGERLNEVAFSQALEAGDAFLLTASYGDRFGSLGKIAAVLGRAEGKKVLVDSWVMSCRAFSRRIEHHCLSYLFEKFGSPEIIAAYTATERNGPLREFLSSVVETELPERAVVISRDDFVRRSPALVHDVEEVDGG